MKTVKYELIKYDNDNMNETCPTKFRIKALVDIPSINIKRRVN